MDIETIKQRLADLYDADELVDLLDLTVEELVEAFEDKVRGNSDLMADIRSAE